MKRLLIIFLLCGAFALAAQTTHSATLTWGDTVNPPGTTYSLYKFVGLCTSPTFSTPLVTGITAKTYQETGLQPGNYAYVMRAVFQAVESTNSNCALAAVLPWAPTGLDRVVSGQRVTLTWADSNPTGTTWSVQHASGLCTGSPTFSTVATGLTAKTYVDNAVAIGQHCYQVTATTNGMQSPASGTTSVQIGPSAPTGLAAQVQ